jgi:diadenosine tetraphosphatase ApaH/serine/threonine PP2A family protein phosphatase
MKAILSDIHGNLEALQAVLEDVARHPVEAIYCLGDVVGYGPNPCECLDLAMSWPVVLLGNHEWAVLSGPQGFAPQAEKALLWTANQLDSPLPTSEAANKRRAFLATCPTQHVEGHFLFVHGSARDPVREYVFPEAVQDAARMRAIFSDVGRYCLQGHTHSPGVFTESLEFFKPEEVSYEYRLGPGKVMVNVGSVGQPRDGDCRASYVLLDGDTVRFRRVDYDLDTTILKIYSMPELPVGLGDRLRCGQ